MSNRYFVAKHGNDLYDPFLKDFFSFPFIEENNRRDLMKTDVSDEGDHYLVKVDVPSFKKEDIKVSLKAGYLTIQAKTQESTENNEKKNKKFIRQERFYGSYSRSFFVGDDVAEADIKAKLEDGVLTIEVGKKELKKEENRYISIE